LPRTLPPSYLCPPLPRSNPILWVNLSSKLASNSKLTSDEHKKHLENNLCLYCSAEDYKLDFCPKKQTTVSPKGCDTSATADTLTATSEKPLEK